MSGVILYHLWPNALPGGFAGVDVFFVISGFLITSLLVTEATSTGRVSLSRFWARRIRRILPAAFTVLLFCVVVVTVVMPRVTWSTNLADIRAAAAYFLNWQLGARSVNYLASSDSATIVQHYWSLSVEEQFYLAWPLLVVGTTWFCRRIFRANLRATLAVVLAVATVISFISSVAWTAHQPAMAFFATPTRAWEFAIGGLIAIVVPEGRGAVRAIRGAVVGVGTIVVVGAMIALSGHDAFPGAIAAVPVGGAAMVIAAGSGAQRSWATRWMLSRPVQWVGDNSYSIYLWHWPLIVATPWMIGEPLHWPAKVAILVGSLVLAGLSKRLLEDPVRSGGFWRARRWPAYGLAATGVVTVVALCASFTTSVERLQHRDQVVAQARSASLVWRPKHRSCFGAAAMVPANHCDRPFTRPRNLDTAFAASDGATDPCLQSAYAPTLPEYCVFGARRHPRQVIAIIGNSHAWRLTPMLALYAQRHDWQVIEASRINCLGLITSATGSNGASSACLSWSQQVEQHLLAVRRLTGVVFASYRYWQEFTAGPSPTTSQVAATEQQILTMWRRYQARNVRVLVVQDVPGMRPSLDPECIQAAATRYDPCSVAASKVIKPTLVTVLAQRYPALAAYIPIDQYFCSGQRCHGLIGGVVVYFDQQHLSSTFARSLAAYVGPQIAAALQAPVRCRAGPASCNGGLRRHGSVVGP